MPTSKGPRAYFSMRRVSSSVGSKMLLHELVAERGQYQGPVSPATRATASTPPVIMPDRAAGITTPSVTRQVGIPRASPASRMPRGPGALRPLTCER